MVKYNVFIYTMEYYSTIKGTSIHVATQSEFENTALSETHQSQMDKYCMSIITGGT